MILNTQFIKVEKKLIKKPLSIVDKGFFVVCPAWATT